MPELAEPLRPARILQKPKKYPPLKNFSCGRKGNLWETTVNKWARRLYLGQQTEPQTVIVLEDAHGKLIGVCSIKPKDLFIPGREPLRGIPYIAMIGTNRLYHGQKLKNKATPGDELLEGVLAHLKRMCGGYLPHVWAFVSPDNDRSQRLFARHDFGELSPLAEGGDAIRLRAPG